MKKIVLLLLGVLMITAGYSQSKINANLQLKTMHYWRGLRVTDGLMSATSVGYFGDNFSAFAWGGLSFNGKYKEVTNVISYNLGGFNVSLTDIWNFSSFDTLRYFDFDQNTCQHLVDITLGYTNEHFKVSWSSIVYGSGDLTTNNSGQKYSSYILLEAPINLDQVKFTPFVAAGLVLNGDDAVLYGNDKYGVANVGFRVDKSFKVGEIEFPISGTLAYNPMLNQASMELAISLF